MTDSLAHRFDDWLEYHFGHDLLVVVTVRLLTLPIAVVLSVVDWCRKPLF